MIRLSVVDDEHIVLNRLKSMIGNINNENLILENTFDNGDDAYNSLSINPPDILITDIHIPFINGMELAKMLKKINPLMKIIVITGYEELSYAKQAIDLEVVGFISKPISKEELELVLDKAIDKIKFEQSVESSIDDYNNFYNDNILVLKENYLAKMLHFEHLDSSYIERLKKVNVDLDYKYTVLAHVDYDKKYDLVDREMFEAFLKKEITNTNFNYDLFHKDEQIFILFKSMDKFLFEELTDNLKTLILKAQRQINIKVSISLSDSHELKNPNFKQMKYETNKALETRRIFGGLSVLLYSDIKDVYVRSNVIDDSTFKELNHLIKYEQDFSKIEEILNHLEVTILNEQYLKLYDFNVSNILNTIIRSINNEYENKAFRYSLLYEELFNYKTNKEVFIFFKNLIKEVQEHNFNSIESKSNHNMELIKNYITNNYMDKDLSLEYLSEEIGFSISYITSLFKSTLKTTFVKYLTNIRMLHAKELLLNSQSKVIEVSDLVGYNDPYYFSYSFKKQFGISPKEFRNE